MTVNQSDLDSFHDSASNLLAKAGRDLELEDLVSQWHAQREHADTIESIRRGIGDAVAGRVHDLADVDAHIRNVLSFPGRH